MNDHPIITELLRDCNRYPRIPTEEMTDYILRARHGDAKARDQICAQYTPMAVAMASERFARIRDLPAVNIELEDLVQEGMRGIVMAIEQYNENNQSDAAFGTCVPHWIQHYINEALTKHSRLIRLPKARITQIRFIYAAMVALETELGREPTVEEIARAINFRFSADEIKTAKDVMSNSLAVSMDSTLPDTDEGTLEDLLADPDDFTEEVLQEELLKELHKCIGMLTEREQLILQYTFGLDGKPIKSGPEIGKILAAHGICNPQGGIFTKQAIALIRDKALRKLYVKLRRCANDFNY